MNSLVFLFLAAIFAGFSLLKLPAVSFVPDLQPFFQIVGVLAIIIFSFVILYMALKALFNKGWR
ncbi:hypothetical protein ACQYAD_11985 [Neobacillus sp. SM06]|uniref:hypothetical protein n=1 Tax=Neobacillus sp. SM06 TaxID=3422492 RepID=UPI003D27C5EA